MGLHHHIRVVALGEGLYGLGDGVGVALVKETAVPVVRVDDRPVVGVGDLTLSEPTCTFPEVEYLVRRPGRRLALPNEAALPACCGWIWPQSHAKKSLGWSRNGCLYRSSSGSPPWPGRSTPASKRARATLHRAVVCPRSPHHHQLAAGHRRGARVRRLLLPARQPGTQVPIGGRSLAPHDPRDSRRCAGTRWCSPSTTRRPSAMARTLRAPASITTRPQGQPSTSSSTATSGSLAWLLRHPHLGTIALPLLARLYVRVKDIGWSGSTAGSSARSWSWRANRSSGWSRLGPKLAGKSGS